MKDLFSVRWGRGGHRRIPRHWGDDCRRLSGQRCQGLYQFPEGGSLRRRAERLAQEYGGICRSIPANLATLEGIDSFCARWEQEDHLDVLINNAGVAWGEPLEQFPEIGWDKVMDTNVKGPFFLIQRLLPELEKQASHERPSHIVNVGSIDGIKTPRFENPPTARRGSHSSPHPRARRPPDQAKHHRQRIAPGPFPTYMLSTGVGGGGKVDDTDWSAVGKGILEVGSALPKISQASPSSSAPAPAVSPWETSSLATAAPSSPKEHPA